MYLAFAKNFGGLITAPSSKSETMRYLFLSVLQNEEKIIYHNNPCDDVLNAINCLRELGIETTVTKTTIKIFPNTAFDSHRIYNINPGDSAFVYRFFLLFCGFFGLRAVFNLSESLMTRPTDDIEKIFKKNNIQFEKKYNLFVLQGGKIKDKNFIFDKAFTSQTISSLLILQTYFENIIIKYDGIDNRYIDLTLDLIEKSKQSNEYYPCGDYSSASYFMIMAALNGEVSFSNLDMNSKQPDKKILDILKDYGAKIKYENDILTVSKAEHPNALTLDIDNCIDLFPSLVMIFAFTNGVSTIKNISRAKIKETDRVLSMTKALNNLKIKYTLQENDLLIYGNENIEGKQFEFNTFFDHRTAMSFFIPTVFDKYIILDNIDCIEKSYYNFSLDFHNCKGELLAKL